MALTEPAVLFSMGSTPYWHHRFEYVLKGIEVEDGRSLEDAVAGDLGVSTLHTLAGHGSPLGEEVGGGVQGLADGLIHLGGHTGAGVLVGASGGQDGAVHRLGVVGQLLPRLLAYLAQQGALPARVQGGQAVCLLIGGHLFGNLHALLKQVHHLLVDGVNFLSQILQFFHLQSLLTYGCNIL